MAAAAGRRGEEGPEGAWTWRRICVSRQRLDVLDDVRIRDALGVGEVDGGAVFDVFQDLLRQLWSGVVNNDAVPYSEES